MTPFRKRLQPVYAIALIGIFGMAVASWLSSCGASSANSTKGVTTVMKASTFGCRHRTFANRFSTLLGEGDKTAAMKMIRGGLDSGECANLDKGERVHIEDTAITDGLVKVRPHGEPRAYWTVQGAVRL